MSLRIWGLPGILVAVICVLVLKEPDRRHVDSRMSNAGKLAVGGGSGGGGGVGGGGGSAASRWKRAGTKVKAVNGFVGDGAGFFQMLKHVCNRLGRFAPFLRWVGRLKCLFPAGKCSHQKHPHD